MSDRIDRILETIDQALEHELVAAPASTSQGFPPYATEELALCWRCAIRPAGTGPAELCEQCANELRSETTTPAPYELGDYLPLWNPTDWHFEPVPLEPVINPGIFDALVEIGRGFQAIADRVTAALHHVNANLEAAIDAFKLELERTRPVPTKPSSRRRYLRRRR